MGKEQKKKLTNPLSLSKERSFRPVKKKGTKNQQGTLDHFQNHMEEVLGITIPSVEEVTETQPVVREVVKIIKEVVEVEKAPDYVKELEDKLIETRETTYDGIDKVMRDICDEHDITPQKLHDDFKEKHNQIPDEWVKEHVKPKTQMEQLADKVAAQSIREESEEENTDPSNVRLERMVVDLRKMVLEQGSIVQSIGFGSPGSGEVLVNRMDDVAVPNGEPADGDFLVWDAFMKKWIPSASVGGGGTPEEFSLVRRDLTVLLNKVASLEEDVKTISEQTGLFLRLEDQTTGSDGDPIDFTRSEFIDTIQDGDTTRFVVGKDRRGVYTLDNVPQPTVELPRGDIIEFDISGLEPNGGDFLIFANNAPMEESLAHTRTDELVRVNTSHIPTSITKLYYRDANVNGLGWVIIITDY